MILKFPDLDTLRLAITSGAAPAAVTLSAAVAGADDQNQIWVETAASLSRGVQNRMREIGVQFCKTNGAAAPVTLSCWQEILPLQPEADASGRLEQTPILFDVSSRNDLGRLINEMLRLGNDRQAFRWLEDKSGAGRGLLRVVGPPYYSLLRAMDRNGSASAPRAYRERAPGVWVEVGWRHPLGEYLKPPAGKMLLITAPREWTWIDDGPLCDVYEVIEFALPAPPAEWNEGVLEGKIRAPLKLTPFGSAEGAEFWVLRDNAVAELNHYVQNADDATLHRLAFAVGGNGKESVIVLRVRPSRLPPPELTLKAEKYKSYLKIPNLFLPAGKGLHPPLRRDMVRKLLADDPASVVWLAPLDGGAFRPETLSEDAFRPLTDWVDYVLDHEQEELGAWIQATQFDFEAFVCQAEEPAKPKKPPAERSRAGKKKSYADAATTEPPASPVDAVERPPPRAKKEKEDNTDSFAIERAEPSALRQQLLQMEERFAGLDGGLDAPERQALWPQLASLNAALNESKEASICWLHALWGQEKVNQEWAWKWFCAEVADLPWASRVAGRFGKLREAAGPDLDELLALRQPTWKDVRGLAAYIVWAFCREAPPQAVRERGDRLHRFIETHESCLSVRPAWLVWTHLSRGDVLALARARDRLLERLFQGDNRPEQELPSFLRSSSRSPNQHFQDRGQWLSQMAEKAREWIGKQGAEWTTQACTPRTREYSDLLFAYGLARVGERGACLQLRDRASAVLGDEDVAHFMLLQGFTYRIQQALDGKPSNGPLPPQMLEDLAKLRAERKAQKEHNPQAPDYAYMVERMRELSRVFEPYQKVDPYRHLTAIASSLDEALAALPDVADKAEAVERVQHLLKGAPKGDRGRKDRNRVVRAGLDLAPRVGEEFGRTMLNEAVALYDAQAETSDPNLLVDQIVPLLEKSLFVAAHFDSVEHIPPLVRRFRALLKAQQDAPELRTLDAAANQCFRGLRKLGMRDEVNQLLQQTADAVLRGQDLAHVRGGALRSMLYVAAGWLYYGQERQAEPVLQVARTVLFRNELPGKDQSALACAYVAAVGQARPELSQKGLQEVFERVENVRDSFWTNNYYSQSQLRLIEAIVAAAVSDDFTLGPTARRWLDDDEYLVRRRIHADYRALSAQAL